MLKQYTKEELWKLYQKLPQELKDALFSEETANHIGNICERYGIAEEIIPRAAKEIGNVLLGLLHPEELQNILIKEIKLKKDVADKVTQEINRFIFYPVKPVLEQLYKMEITPSEKVAGKPMEKPEIKEEKPPSPPGKDTYREQIE